jgi:radical SAM protein with 4Fe4S-binding SPASM domain
MIKKCDELISTEGEGKDDYVFNCGTGKGDFTISYDGKFKLCSSLCNPALTYDLRIKGNTVKDGFKKLLPLVFGLRSGNKEFLERCCSCTIGNLCICCPAHAWIESGQLDKPIDYFCDVAHARAAALMKETEKLQ